MRVGYICKGETKVITSFKNCINESEAAEGLADLKSSAQTNAHF